MDAKIEARLCQDLMLLWFDFNKSCSFWLECKFATMNFYMQMGIPFHILKYEVYFFSFFICMPLFNLWFSTLQIYELQVCLCSCPKPSINETQLSTYVASSLFICLRYFRVQVLEGKMLKVLGRGWCMGWNYNHVCDWLSN